MATADAAQTAETVADLGSDAQRWIGELQLADKAQQPFIKERRRIFDKYAKQKDGSTPTLDNRLSLFWSNIQTIAPAVWGRVPEPVVSRRFKDADPIGRVASEVLERGLAFSLDACDFAEVMENVRLDYLLSARAVAWVRYVPKIEQDEGDEVEDAAGGEAPEPQRRVAWEEAVFDYVDGADILHSVSRTWAELRWIGRATYLTRDELIKRFPKCGKDVPLDHKADTADTSKEGDSDEQFAKACVWEIWDKASETAIWISRSYPTDVLDKRPDPLKLKDFFPCPRFALGTRAPDSLIPVPDFAYYEAQLKKIDKLDTRIGKMMDALKLVGFYAAGGDTKDPLKTALASETGTLVPIESWAALMDKGGVKGLIEWVPLDVVVAALKAAIEARQQLIEDMYQVTGIADVMRGEVDPQETATATATKGNWGSIRVREKQKELARFARDLLRIAGQIIAKQFDPETLAAMSNIQLFQTVQQKQQAQAALQQQAMMAQQSGQPAPPPPPEMMAMMGKPTWEEVCGLLQNDTLRSFRIDVETDSTIEPDDQEEKQRQIEFTQAVAELLAKALPVLQMQPTLIEMFVAMLMALVRKFRAGREVEDTIQRAMDQLQQGASQPQQQQPQAPNPQAEQAKAQAAQTSAQAKVMDAQTNQMRAQTERGKAIADTQIAQGQIQAENQRTEADRAAEMHMHGQGLAADLQQAVMNAEKKQLVHEINDQHPIKAPTR